MDKSSFLYTVVACVDIVWYQWSGSLTAHVCGILLYGITAITDLMVRTVNELGSSKICS